MLFRKKQPKICCYCMHGTNIADGQILCVKRGVRYQEDSCARFCYDPCKRIPPKATVPDLTRFEEDDFSL